MTQDEMIAHEYQEGATFRDLQKKYNVATARIKRALRSQGVTSRKRGGRWHQAGDGQNEGKVKTTRIDCLYGLKVYNKTRKCVMYSYPGSCAMCLNR